MSACGEPQKGQKGVPENTPENMFLLKKLGRRAEAAKSRLES